MHEQDHPPSLHERHAGAGIRRFRRVRRSVWELDAKVTSLDEKVNSLDTKVASLDAKVNSLDTKVASLDAKVNSLDADVRGIKVVLENEVRRDLNLLAEGHAAILERLPSQEEKEALEARMDAMEAAIRLHSKQIRELKKAQ